MTEWVLRNVRDEDRNYILSSWLRSYAEAPEFRSVEKRVYYRLYEPLVKAMLSRSAVAVATLPDAPDVVLGWMAIEDDALHYVLVKPRWRKLGIAKWLVGQLEGIDLVYTHPPASVAAIHMIQPNWTYDPIRRFPKEAA